MVYLYIRLLCSTLYHPRNLIHASFYCINILLETLFLARALLGVMYFYQFLFVK